MDHRRGGGAQDPMDETAVCCARLDDFYWVVPDRFPDILESGFAMEEHLPDLKHVDEVLPFFGRVCRGDCCAGVLVHGC